MVRERNNALVMMGYVTFMWLVQFTNGVASTM